MGRKRTPGLRNRGGIWHIKKQILGHPITGSTGTSSLDEAELILARRIEETRKAILFGTRKRRTWEEAAAKYLEENLHLASISDVAKHIEQMGPYLNHLPLENVHQETLVPFIEYRRAKVKTKSINNALGIVRRILNLSARLWRDEHGLTWLETAPLIQFLPVTDARAPYPLSWDEQRRLFQALPLHLARMCLFKVNTGTREQEVCGLRWEWEYDGVFIVPGSRVKNGEDRVIVLNRVAMSVIKEVKGLHPEFVFTYDGHRVGKINNSAWKRVRRETGIPVRVHDLKHTFGRRLRAAGVPLETRRVLLGHKNGDITTHYSKPEINELLRAANKVVSDKNVTLKLMQEKAATKTAVNT